MAGNGVDSELAALIRRRETLEAMQATADIPERADIGLALEDTAHEIERLQRSSQATFAPRRDATITRAALDAQIMALMGAIAAPIKGAITAALQPIEAR